MHHNYQGIDPITGISIISVMNTADVDGQKSAHIIVRLSTGSSLETFQADEVIEAGDTDSVLNLVKIICPELTVEKLELLTQSPETEGIIVDYDDKIHENQLKRDYRFGVLYQEIGQVDETEIFGNIGHSEKFENFLKTLGEKVSTDDGKDYVGTKFQDYSLKFHVSTLLPHSSSDSQQCKRKARIGNDVVCIVFQSGETTFSPEIITSQFLHVYIGRFSTNPTTNIFKRPFITKLD